VELLAASGAALVSGAGVALEWDAVEASALVHLF
jgi:hypothetical protein